jgi:hypothetical protein
MAQPLPERLIISRRAAGLVRPRKPRTRIDPDSLAGVVMHWFGIPKGERNHAKCDDVWRGVQRGHMAGEFIDIAYNMGVCPHGKIYRGRGTHYRSGANGNAQANSQFGSVVFMAGEGGPTPSEVALDSLHLVVRQYRHLGAGKLVVPHGQITGSQCPGPQLRAAIARGRFK